MFIMIMIYVCLFVYLSSVCAGVSFLCLIYALVYDVGGGRALSAETTGILFGPSFPPFKWSPLLGCRYHCGTNRFLAPSWPSHVVILPKQVQADDVLVEQGRHAVSIGEMLMRPVFWAFSGQVRLVGK